MMIENLNRLRVVLAAAAGGVLLAVGMPMVAAVSPAEAAFPGQNGKIAFSSTRDGNGEIYTMSSNGQAIDRLTNNPKPSFEAAWSPDGNKIAFMSTRDGNNEIYTMNANGTGLDRLTNDPKADGKPAWSPDGNKIAFESNRDGNLEIYTMNPNGQGIDPLTNSPATDFQPAWSPNGDKIAFTSNRDDNVEIYTMNANGQGVDRLTNNPARDSYPDWQPLSPAPNPTPPNPTPPNNPSPPNNTTAPKVLSTSPQANASRVAPTASLKATFSEKMQPASLKSAFKLFKNKKGSNTNKLSARVSYNAATKQATLNPSNSLRRGVTYKAVVTTEAKDVAGNQLDQNPTKAGLQQKVWSFKVRR